MLSFHPLYRAKYLKIKDIFAFSEVHVFFQHPPPLSFFGRRKAPPEVTRMGLFFLSWSLILGVGLFCSGKCQVRLTGCTMYSQFCMQLNFLLCLKKSAERKM